MLKVIVLAINVSTADSVLTHPINYSITNGDFASIAAMTISKDWLRFSLMGLILLINQKSLIKIICNTMELTPCPK